MTSDGATPTPSLLANNIISGHRIGGRGGAIFTVPATNILHHSGGPVLENCLPAAGF